MQPSLPFEPFQPPQTDLAPHQTPDGQRVPLEPALIRHPRARRYVVRVRDDGSVRVTIPRWGSKREAKAFAEAQRPWIEGQLAKLARERARPRMELTPEAEAAFRARAKQELPPRLLALAAEHGVRVGRVSVRNQRWRWGSCSRGGHICLNWRLVAMPEWVRDYVLVHELMHLRRMDHSPAFWTLVRRACPEYLAARAWLRAHQQWLTAHP